MTLAHNTTRTLVDKYVRCYSNWNTRSVNVLYLYLKVTRLMPQNPKQVSDQEILEGLRTDGKVRRHYEQVLYKRFVSLVWGRPRKYRLTEDQARQAYNDAIIGFLRQVDGDKFRGESSLYTYIRSIFIRRCIDIFRSSPTIDVYEDTLDEHLELPDHSVNLLRKIISQEEIQQALDTLSKLGSKCKELLILSAEGFKMPEIAEKLGFKSVESTYSTKHQCKKKLLQMMKSYSPS